MVCAAVACTKWLLWVLKAVESDVRDCICQIRWKISRQLGNLFVLRLLGLEVASS